MKPVEYICVSTNKRLGVKMNVSILVRCSLFVFRHVKNTCAQERTNEIENVFLPHEMAFRVNTFIRLIRFSWKERKAPSPVRFFDLKAAYFEDKFESNNNILNYRRMRKREKKPQAHIHAQCGAVHKSVQNLKRNQRQCEL